ncbi:MAG TPA: SSI family serine proteinase inhibitor [Actinotalea sp.]|nr:SSI family serine proteinase inhibitor [Actinotalea sp.]
MRAPTAPVAADLTVSLDSTGSGTSETWTLTCEPAGGDHPDPDAACAALAAAGGAPAFDPVPRDTAGTEIWGGPQVATVEGTVDGVRVSADFSRTNGCEISRWDALADLLGSPGGA